MFGLTKLNETIRGVKHVKVLHTAKHFCVVCVCVFLIYKYIYTVDFIYSLTSTACCVNDRNVEINRIKCIVISLFRSDLQTKIFSLITRKTRLDI